MSEKLKNIPEINLKVIIIGIILSVVMGSANVYLGLKAGMTVSASIPAAVLGMLILRYIGSLNSSEAHENILEANQIQTAASAGESLAAGIIFTMPALILIGVWQEFNMFLTTVIAFTGGLLGILFMIPMRQVFIVKNEDNLQYPEGLACASVLEAGQTKGGSENASLVIKGAIIGGLFKGLISFAGLLKGVLEGAILLGNRIFFFGGDISPALLAVGFIVKLNIAVLIFIGGFLGWLVGIPLLGHGLEHSANPLEGAWNLWSTQIRYVGVGAMVIGGISSIFRVRKGLLDAVKILFDNQKDIKQNNIPINQRDISKNIINIFSLIAVVLVAGVYFFITKNLAITIVTTVIMIIMAFFFTAVASYIVGLVGNSNSPVSGMTITAVLFTGGLLYVFGFSGTKGMIATLGVAAIVCCAACTSGDVCNDLKTGQIVGASPFRQQIMQIIGIAVASIVMAPIMQLLHENTPGGIGGRELSAPQAGLFASLAKGFFGDGILPWNMVAIGAVLGIIILIADYFLVFWYNLKERISSSETHLNKNNQTNEIKKFRLHLMPIAVGIYLPFGLATPILVGGIIAHFISKKYSLEKTNSNLQNGVLLSSGLIAGESLMGILLAFIAGAGITNLNLGLSTELLSVFTILASITMVWYLYENSKIK
ncbi:MAG: oligopeptide transporter, OPT family [Candidatus Marinimicrobia bacterium]|nr:oligopeptide transporter, OPT family [Candidatus Neomarinimicrobiota bacterium]